MPLKVREWLLKLENMKNNSVNYRDVFITHVKQFYSNCVTYLQNWSINLSKLKLFGWINLTKQIWIWTEILILSSCEAFKDYIGPVLNQDDEVNVVRINVTEDKIADWSSRTISAEDRWLELFQIEKVLKNVKILCEFVFCLPGTSASLERLFSNINNYWSPEKSQLKVSTLEAIMHLHKL